MRTKKSSGILTAASQMAVRITCAATRPDCPAGKWEQDGIICWTSILCPSAPRRTLDVGLPGFPHPPDAEPHVPGVSAHPMPLPSSS